MPFINDHYMYKNKRIMHKNKFGWTITEKGARIRELKERKEPAGNEKKRTISPIKWNYAWWRL